MTTNVKKTTKTKTNFPVINIVTEKEDYRDATIRIVEKLMYLGLFGTAGYFIYDAVTKTNNKANSSNNASVPGNIPGSTAPGSSDTGYINIPGLVSLIVIFFIVLYVIHRVLRNLLRREIVGAPRFNIDAILYFFGWTLFLVGVFFASISTFFPGDYANNFLWPGIAACVFAFVLLAFLTWRNPAKFLKTLGYYSAVKTFFNFFGINIDDRAALGIALYVENRIFSKNTIDAIRKPDVTDFVKAVIEFNQNPKNFDDLTPQQKRKLHIGNEEDFNSIIRLIQNAKTNAKRWAITKTALDYVPLPNAESIERITPGFLKREFTSVDLSAVDLEKFIYSIRSSNDRKNDAKGRRARLLEDKVFDDFRKISINFENYLKLNDKKLNTVDENNEEAAGFIRTVWNKGVKLLSTPLNMEKSSEDKNAERITINDHFNNFLHKLDDREKNIISKYENDFKWFARSGGVEELLPRR